MHNNLFNFLVPEVAPLMVYGDDMTLFVVTKNIEVSGLYLSEAVLLRLGWRTLNWHLRKKKEAFCKQQVP